MKTVAVVSCEAEAEERVRLGTRFDVVTLPPDPLLPVPVAHHPDMLFFSGWNTLFFHRSYYERFPAAVEDLVRRTGMRLVLSDAPRGPRYPADIGADALFWRGLISGRLDALFPEILTAAAENGAEAVPVRQGYAGCACLACGDALLTSDEGIYTRLRRRFPEVWFCPPDGIRLPGYSVGFPGGASGFYDGTVYFFGDPASMEYAETLSRFLDHYGLDCVLLSEGPLTDRGGIRFLTPVQSQ